jgi:YHS domain-containing protein
MIISKLICLLAYTTYSTILYICKILLLNMYSSIYLVWRKTLFVIMNIDEKTAKYTSEINGNKVYLCSSACKQQLEQNPSKYGY